MENDNDERALRRSFCMSAMMDVIGSLHDNDTEHLELEQARAVDRQFFPLVELLLARGLDQFASSTKTNTSVKTVSLDIGFHRIYDDYGREIDRGEYYKRWARLAEGLGKLAGLKELRISSQELLEDPENVPDYCALGKVLKCLPQLENLSFCCSLLAQDGIEEVALALNQHPNLRQIHFEQRTDVQALETITRQLLTIPNMETVEFGFLTILQRRLPSLFSSLVGMKSLKVLRLHKCTLSESQCDLMVNILGRRQSRLELLDLQHSLIEGAGGSRILQGLQDQGTIRSLQLSMWSLNEQSCVALATLVSTLSSLEEVKLAGRTCIDPSSGEDALAFRSDWLGPLFDKLSSSLSLKVLTIGAIDSWSNQLTKKLGAALESKKCSLEVLVVTAHNMAPNLNSLMPSLAANASLRKLSVGGGLDRHGAIELASHLSRNDRLEELALFVAHDDFNGEAGQWNERFTIARCVEALASNTGIKRLHVRFPHRFEAQDVSPRGTQELESAFKRNYSLEQVTGRYDRKNSHVPTLCQLNKAGRKYLIEDHLDRARGVQVLAQVSTNLHALFFHLLENPALCADASVRSQGRNKKRVREEANTNLQARKRVTSVQRS